MVRRLLASSYWNTAGLSFAKSDGEYRKMHGGCARRSGEPLSSKAGCPCRSMGGPNFQAEPKTFSGRSRAQNAHIPVNNGGSPTERPFRKYLAMGSVSEQCRFDTLRAVHVKDASRKSASNKTRRSLSRMASCDGASYFLVVAMTSTVRAGLQIAFAKLSIGGLLVKGRVRMVIVLPTPLFDIAVQIMARWSAILRSPGGCSARTREPSGNRS